MNGWNKPLIKRVRAFFHPFCFKNLFIKFCVTLAIIIASLLFLFIKSRDSLHFNGLCTGKLAMGKNKKSDLESENVGKEIVHNPKIA